MWVGRVDVRDFRNIREAGIELTPGLNIFWGRNAQGKTTLLESVGLLARGRSFRTEQTQTLIRRGAPGLWARGLALGRDRKTTLEVHLGADGRRLLMDGRVTPPRAYHGQLEVIVYSTDRLRVVRGTMRDRRQFLDRTASVLWPAYKALVSEYERVLLQRNAALEAHQRDLDAWTERLLVLGSRLRFRRSAYVERLRRALQSSIPRNGEQYEVTVTPSAPDEESHSRILATELEASQGRERAARRTLVGPHRDAVRLEVDGQDAAIAASSGQARSLLLALTLAALDVHREETGEPAVALLDDLDSELDEDRAAAVCRDVASRGQALVTTAHRGWADQLSGIGARFVVNAGVVSPMVS